VTLLPSFIGHMDEIGGLSWLGENLCEPNIVPTSDLTIYKNIKTLGLVFAPLNKKMKCEGWI
jgi:hypothetical protein